MGPRLLQMDASRIWNVASWRLSFLLVLTICLGGVPGSQGQGIERRLSGSYTVSQSYKLLVHDSGNVDVVMLINFHLKPGAQLSGSYKSILAETNIQSIEGGRVIATDSDGRGLPLQMLDRDGWIRVDFSFPETMYGSTTPRYGVNLTYTVVNGICMGSARFHRFSLPWAHRWAVTVTDSKYEIEFANPNMDLLMDSVCFGSSGFTLKCGQELLTIAGKHASYKATGSPHGVFFEWSGVRRNPVRRHCADYRDDGAPSGFVLSKSANSEDLPEVGQSSTALTVGAVSVGSSCLFAVFMCACALKMPLRMKFADDKRLSDSNSDSTDDSLMTLDTGADCSGGNGTPDKVDRRPRALDIAINDDCQLQRRTPMSMHTDLEAGIGSSAASTAAASTAYTGVGSSAASSATLGGGRNGDRRMALEHDNGAGVWSSGDPRSIVAEVGSWEVEDEFLPEATNEDKFGFAMDDAGSPMSPGIRGLYDGAPSMPPPVPESQLRPHSSDQSATADDDWQAMSEFGVEDQLERGVIELQTSSTVDMMSGMPAFEGQGGLMPLSNLEAYPALTSSVGNTSLESQTWEVMEEFADGEPSAHCKPSLTLAL